MNTANANLHKSCGALTASLLLITSGASLNAATVLIDWSKTTIITTDSDGNNWNSLGLNSETGGDLTTIALIDSTGAATGVTVSLTTGGGSGSGFGDFDGAAGPDPYDEAAVHDDGMFNGGYTSDIPITFNGLLASTEYAFTMINRRASNGNDGRIRMTTGTSTDIDSTGLKLVLNGAVLSFNATSDASGTLAFGFREWANAAGGTVMNGMTLTPVPEPAAALLGGLGFLFLLRRRR